MQTVITYQTSRNLRISLTPEQVAKLEAAGKWPRDWSGEEYASVSHGKHAGNATYTDAELAKEVGLETL